MMKYEPLVELIETCTAQDVKEIQPHCETCRTRREHHAGGQALCLLRFLLDRISPLCYSFYEELNERSVNCEERRTHDAVHEAPTSWSSSPPRPRHLAADPYRREGPLFCEGLQRRFHERDRRRGAGDALGFVLPFPQG